jgi:hypothetical protein
MDGLLRDASSAQVMFETGEHFRQDDRLGQKGIPPDPPATRLDFPFVTAAVRNTIGTAFHRGFA